MSNEPAVCAPLLRREVLPPQPHGAWDSLWSVLAALTLLWIIARMSTAPWMIDVTLRQASCAQAAAARMQDERAMRP